MRDGTSTQPIVRNLGWAVAAILLAVMIWTAANIERNPIDRRELRRLPVVVELPEGFVQVGDPVPSTVDVIIRTNQSEWELLGMEDVILTADLTHKTEPGSYDVNLEGSIAPPLHGQVVDINPRKVKVEIDREKAKLVPVRVIVSNEPPLGYTYPSDLSGACSTIEVTVKGSEQRVNSVDHVEVRMNLSDERNPITNRLYPVIAVEAGGNTVRNIELTPANVDCSVDIQPREDVFQMPVLPRVEGDPPPGYNFDGYSVVEPDTIGLTGNRRAIRELGGLVRTEAIDLTDRTATFTIEVPVDLPEGVSLVPENQLISVTVEISSQASTRQFEDVPVEVTGLDGTLYQATGLANTVTVFVSAPPDLMPNFEDLRVEVDLRGLQVGIHQVEPKGRIAGQEEDDRVQISVQPDTLSVTIESLNPTPTPSPTPTGTPVRPSEMTPTPSDS